MRLKPHHFVLALAALLALPLAADEAKGTAPGTPAAPGAAAMKVHVDPATGQLSAPAAGTQGALAAAPAGRLPALKVEKVTTAAGGRKIRLDDRFMMEVKAATAPDGKVAVTCNEATPAATVKEEPHHDR
ncbi:MAG: hypothetical protein U0529_12940 [Thermoanaerobaculia bacterium]